MQRLRRVTLVLCSVALLIVSSGAAATASTSAKKKPKVHCDPKTAAAKIAPLFDQEANSQNTLAQHVATIQFGNLKTVKAQVAALDAANTLETVRANPTKDITFPDKRSAIGTLIITLDEARTKSIDQGPQFYMCVGKDQNGTKKGAWRITLYSFCNVSTIVPCSDALVAKALNALTPALTDQITNGK